MGLRLYHGTWRWGPIKKKGYIGAPVYVTRSLRIAKAQANRRRGLGPLVVLVIDGEGYRLKKDKMYRRWSRDPLLGPTYKIDKSIPVSKVMDIIKEERKGQWNKEVQERYDKYFK